MTEMEILAAEEAAEARFDKMTDVLVATLIPVIIAGTLGTAIHQVGLLLGWWS